MYKKKARSVVIFSIGPIDNECPASVWCPTGDQCPTFLNINS